MNNNNYKWQLTALAVLWIVLCGTFLWIVDLMVKNIGKEEMQKMELWANATNLIAQQQLDENQIVDFLLQIIQSNTTIPVIVTNCNDSILTIRNIDIDAEQLSTSEASKLIQKFKAEGRLIDIPITQGEVQHLYYSESGTLKLLSYMPAIEMFLVLIFCLLAYIVFSQIKRAEQDKVWIGLARETAHQLGTPITALSGWTELMRSADIDMLTAATEIAHDTERLKSIAARFSKIGSKPKLELRSINETIAPVVAYLQTRLPKNISISISANGVISTFHNPTLLGWAVENLCRNSADAIEGSGKIDISIYKQDAHTLIDVTDTGKGMTRVTARHIFEAGYTTKERGWGIGLTLVKRIVCEYHKGKIYVADTEIGRGTTIRIVI